ncbi:unnamed protein product [Kuraishia capsulata CBS 1993]|uniref:SEC7 domain-containing protein n=1 Tax=Kuraishia capsulata CBS 1993 TaxID=1382522 RepID=W6MHT8_9ASCO|nr:uncharacterized protein KUCA_T00001885001 [Kuraishia capsulata CBS 1993]CDK25914.1 unnamed protein product [Kuraishia capsulata CBS 1993]
MAQVLLREEVSSLASSISGQMSPMGDVSSESTTQGTEVSFSTGKDDRPHTPKLNSVPEPPSPSDSLDVTSYSPLLQLLRSDEINGQHVSKEHLRYLRDVSFKLFMREFSNVNRKNYLTYLGGGSVGGSSGDDPMDIAFIRCFYMSFFKWDANLLRSLRLLCENLYFKGESQYIDKILDSFATSWYYTHGDSAESKIDFGSSSGVYLVAYSLILLNTDLHNSDIDKRARISKSSFIKNTFEALKQNDVSLQNRAEVEVELKTFYEDLLSEELKLTGTNGTKQRSKQYADMADKAANKRASVSSFNSFMPAGSTPTYSNRTNLNYERSYGHNAAQPVGFASALQAERTVRRMSSHDSIGNISRSSSIGTLSTVLQKIDSNDTAMSIQDETFVIEEEGDLELELEGPPWAKEGLVFLAKSNDPVQQPAPYENRGAFSGWLSRSKTSQSKSRLWPNLFVVASKGELKLFSFEVNQGGLKGKKSVSDIRRSCNRDQQSQTIGDGNWLSSANCVGSYSLCSTLARVIDAKSSSYKLLCGEYRNNVPHKRIGDSTFWALTLPLADDQKMSNQETLIFCAGTQEIAKEFVDTCNFWSARSSSIPPEDAISSIDYGFSPKLAQMDKASVVKYLNSTTIIKWTPFIYGLIPTTFPMLEQLTKLKTYHTELVNKVNQHKTWITVVSRIEKHAQDLVAPSSAGFLRRSRKTSDASASAVKNLRMIKLNYQNKLTYLENELARFKAYVRILQKSLESRQKKLQESAEEEDDFFDTSEYTVT